MKNYKSIAEEIFNLVDIKINGTNPWDIIVHNNNMAWFENLRNN